MTNKFTALSPNFCPKKIVLFTIFYLNSIILGRAKIANMYYYSVALNFVRFHVKVLARSNFKLKLTRWAENNIFHFSRHRRATPIPVFDTFSKQKHQFLCEAVNGPRPSSVTSKKCQMSIKVAQK